MLLILYTCLLWLFASGLWDVQAEDPISEKSLRNHPRGLAPANVDFAFSLYKQLVASAPGKNIFISPVSVTMALVVLSLGAKGSTRTKLFQGLGFNLTETPEAEIHRDFQHLRHLLGDLNSSLEMTMGNALFMDHLLEPLESFSTNSKRYYESEAFPVDLQDLVKASRQINEYIKNKTQGKIVDLFPNLESTASLILVNYIYLNGTWKHPFDPEMTSEEDFHLSKNSTVKVPMMSQLSLVKFLNDSVLPCQLVQLDYTGNGTVFFILPEEGEIDTIIKALSRDTIQRWSDSQSWSLVQLSIPKLSLSGLFDLNGVLADMGLADLFTDQANFSSITQEAQVKVSKVIHKSVLHLDETSVNAANVSSQGSPEHVLKMDRPFLITMFDNATWSSLFLGKVVSPT
ncbi:corticosteroid-binding globulin [Rhynchocyon petersi]